MTSETKRVGSVQANEGERSTSGSQTERTERDPLLERTDTQVATKKLRVSRQTVRNMSTAVCLWLCYLVVSAAYSLLGPFFPEEAADKGASPTVVGVIVSSSPLCVVIFSPIFGYLLPQLGLRFTLVSGLLLVGGAFTLLGFMSSPQISSGWMFAVYCVVLRTTEGIGSSMFFTAAFALLPELFPNHVGTSMGLFEVAAGIGYSVGPPLGGVLYNAGGFALPFQVVGGASLLFIIPCFLLTQSSECKAQSLSWTIIKMLGTNFTIILLTLANMLAVASLSFLTPTMQPFLHRYFNLDPLHVGLVFLGGPLTYMLFSLIVGPLSDKLGPRYFILAGQLLYAVSFIFLGPADFISPPQLWITIVAFAVVGCGAGLGMVPIYADILAISKRISPDVESEALTSVLSGVMSSTLSFGEFAGPLVSGGLAQYFDFQTSALLFGEVVFAVGLLLIGVTVINRVLPPRGLTVD